MEAPNIRGNYPGGGERLGPAWQTAWDTIGPSRRYTPGSEVAEHTAAGSGVSVKTVKMLLWKAVRAKRLEQTYRTVDGRRRVFYRRATAYRETAGGA